MTIWPARRVKDRILCGRQVAGRYVCTGELAKIGRVGYKRGVVRPVGTTALPSILADQNDPYDERHRIDHVDWSARAKRQIAEGRRPDAHLERGDRGGRGLPGEFHSRAGWPRSPLMEYEFTRRCPNCDGIGLVDPKRLAPEPPVT